MRAATRLAFVILNAARNQYNWDFYANGEVWTVRWAMDNFDGAVIDVGANEGQWASSALPYLGDRPLHCFEIVPEIYDRLRVNLSPIKQVTLNQVGLGDRPGMIEFNHCVTTPEVSSRYEITSTFRSGVIERIAVAVTTGDSYCKSSGIDKIALLKIDVEGMEYEVLAGFSHFLATGRVAAIQFEYGAGYIAGRHYLKDVCDLLTASGYEVFRQYPKGIEPFIYSDLDEDFRARNFVAVRI
jgi:FkbM family methyltransferase